MAMTWYTADLHFGHANIIRYCDRPWSTPDEMDAALVSNWNAVVAPGDTVWVLGDVVLRRDALAPVASLNGRKILVAGNHDSCWTGHRRRRERARRSVAIYRDAGFDDVHETGVVRDHTIAGRRVVLSHLPYAGDHTDTDRYADRRPDDDGLPLLCGHVHDTWRALGRQINVGVDVWDYFPVAESTLAAILDADHASSSGSRPSRSAHVTNPPCSNG